MPSLHQRSDEWNWYSPMWGQSRELMPGEEMGSSFLGSGEGGGRLRWRQVSWQHLGVKGIQLPRKALAKGSDRKTRSKKKKKKDKVLGRKAGPGLGVGPSWELECQ